jgi:SAM-dependent methyltransferase
MRLIIKKSLGTTWSNPIINLATHVIDIPDYIARRLNGLGHLPLYSERIRSNGFRGQFDGKNFDKFGKLLGNLLIDYCNLQKDSSVMEIGCGVGRTALFLSEYLENGTYLGWDIDKKSIEIASALPKLNRPGFNFEYVNYQNELYNREGTKSNMDFPGKDQSLDVVFLVSVFTHMYPEDITLYLKEIAKKLRNGGSCLFSTFLLDNGPGNTLTFHHEFENYYINRLDIPLQAIGFKRVQLEEIVRPSDLKMERIIKGNWRSDKSIGEVDFGQDIIILRRT